LTEKLSEPGKTNTQNFKFVNAGKFAWGTPQVDWKTGTEPKHVTLDASNCNDSLAISPLGSCSFTLTTTKDNPGDWGKLDIKGDNLAPNPFYIDVLCAGVFSIIENTDTADLHLGYRSIKVASTVIEGTATLTTTTPIATVDGTDKIKYCAAGDTDCTYQTNCATGTVLKKYGEANDSCLIWFKSINSGSSTLYKETAGTITVNEITGTGSVKDKDGNYPTDSETEKFTTDTDQALYVAGAFTSPGNHITKYNDVDGWKTLGTGTNADSFVFAVAKGDLYNAGQFTTIDGVAANYIAKYNGANWSALGSGTSDYITALYTLDDNLYVGGKFLSAGGLTTARTIAKWDGANWSALAQGLYNAAGPGGIGFVRAIISLGKKLYIGGSVHEIINTPAPDTYVPCVAQWDTETSTWSPYGNFGSNNSFAFATIGTTLFTGGDFSSANFKNISQRGLSDPNWTWLIQFDGFGEPVYALTSIGNDLYIGGNFTRTNFFPYTEGNRMMKWNSGSGWSALGTGLNSGVNALISLGTDIYVAGEFTTAGGLTAQSIAKWDTLTSTWSPIGTGTELNAQADGIIITTSLDTTWSCTPGDPDYPCS
ncbi:MAG: hypothetical protein KKE11_05060, partial [Gammaproteobacteria bacterium]|nr:hypothetical protein [Gammaproteobacteria bacterium]